MKWLGRPRRRLFSIAQKVVQRPWLPVLALFLACSPTLSPPSVAPSGVLGKAPGPTTKAPPRAFAVVFAGPEGDAPERPEISVVFNRPLRALGPVGSTPTPPITLTPHLNGKWRWIGTSALLFLPEGGTLPLATRFEVDVPKGLRSIGGEVLNEGRKFSFSTERPRIANITPYSGSRDLAPDTQFELFANQAITPSSLKKFGQLTAIQGEVRQEIPFDVKVSTPEDPKHLILTPKKKLPGGHTIELSFSADLPGAEGPLLSGAKQTFQFETYGPLRVSELSCARGDSELCYPGGSVWVHTSNPVRFGDLKKAISVSPKTALSWESWRTDDDLTSYTDLNLPMRPGAKYTVHVKGPLRDIYGQALAAPDSHTFEIDNFRPAVEIGASGDYFDPSTKPELPIASVNVPSFSLYTRALSEADVTDYVSSDSPERALEQWLKERGGKARTVRPDAAPNEVGKSLVDTSKILEKSAGKGPLLVAVTYTSRGSDESRAKLLQVTNLAITAKLSASGRSVVWVTEMGSGKPVVGAEVGVRGPSTATGTVSTGPEGIAVLPEGALGPEVNENAQRRLIFARKGSDFAFRRVSEYLSPWRLPVSTDTFGTPREYGLLFTERGIYRPGDEVHIKGILRREAEGGNALLTDRQLTLRLRGPDYEEMEQFSVKTGAFGTFSHTFRIPATAPLGSFRVDVAELENRGSAATGFEVAEYRPVEMEAKASSDRPSYVQGTKATYSVQGDYLYGAPMAKAQVTYRASRIETNFSIPGHETLTTDASVFDSAYPDRAPSAGILASGDATLDAKGHLAVAVPLSLPGQRGPELVSFDAEVMDVSRQTVATSSSALVHPGNYYIGLAPLDPYFISEEAKLQTSALVASPEGKVISGRPMRFELFRRKWMVIRGKYGSEYSTVDESVSSCQASSKAAVSGCELAAKGAGYYLIVATVTDEKGRTMRAATDAYVIGKGESAWRDADDFQVEIVPDKKSYRVGDRARVLIKSPFKKADALVTIEADGAREERRVTLSGATPTIEVPITDALRPNAYVSVHLLKPSTHTAGESTSWDAPSFRVGYAELRVDPEARRLKIGLTPNKRDFSPGETIQVDLDVRDQAGKPADSELTVYAVDEGVLSLIGYKTPDPLPVFTASRPLRVATLEARESLGVLNKDLAELLGLGPNKGAEGGGGGGADGTRRDFRQSAYFSPNVRTDSKGKAHLSFVLPQSLTTYRLMAVAVTKEDRYGYAETRVTTSKRLMARPALPRFFRAGDRASAGLVVSAKNFGPTKVEVALETSGIDVEGPKSVQIELPRDGSEEVRFELRPNHVGTAKLKFRLRSLDAGGPSDSVEVERRVLLPGTLETVAAYGETEATSAQSLAPLSDIRSDVGGLEVQLSSTALVGLDDGFEQLLDYPYGCTEKLSSKLLPLLPLRDLAARYHVRLPANPDKFIESSIRELVTRQRGDGGFGMWPESERSSEWVTPYALWTLNEAKKRGFSVPDGVFARGKDYLRRLLDDPANPWLLASAAFAVDVLGELGTPDPGYENRLFAKRAELPIFARALLLHAMAKSQRTGGEVEALTRELENGLRIEANRAAFVENIGDGYAVTMDSPVRTSALVLRALLKAQPHHPLSGKLARGLLSDRTKGSWRTTQETAFALLALSDYQKSEENVAPDFLYRVWSGEKTTAQGTFRGADTLVKEHTFAIGDLRPGNLSFEKQGKGKLFYEARLRYALKELPKDPLDEGFYVQKTYREVTPTELSSAIPLSDESSSDVKAGGLVLVDLVLVTPSPRNFAVIDDPLPAGFEAVDSSLSTSASWTQTAGTMTHDSSYDGTAHGRAFRTSYSRRELRDDRVVYFLDGMPAGMYHYRYLARATTPGTYLIGPTKAEEMYTPEVFGRTGALSITVH